jgi:uncharacterized protein (TIGR03083 family)
MSEETHRQLVEAHRGVFAGLRDAVTGLDDAGWARMTGCPGWTVHDQLAHVIGIERAMLGDPPDEVEVPDVAYVKNEFGRAVEAAVQARREWPQDELLREAEEVFARRIEMLESLDASALQEPMDGFAGMRAKASQMLRTRVFDMVCHEHDIRRAVGRGGGTEGPHVDISVEQVVRAWARVLPEAHDGGVLEVVVDDRSPVRLDLADGTLHRDGSGPQPTATVRLGVSDLLAVAGGRSDAPEIDDLEVEGDRDWANRVLEGAVVTP